MPIFKIFKILDKKQISIFILFFILSLISMLLETISIGLLIPFVSTIVSDTEPKNFYKLIKFLEFESKTKEEILFSIALIILIVQSLKSVFLTIYSFIEQKFLTTIRLEISNRLFHIYDALKLGLPFNTVQDLTKIDKWFLNQINELVLLEREAQNYELDTLPKNILKLIT